MGEEDEGFDEEFCDTEDPPLRQPPHNLPPLNLQELNTSDLQSFLVESTLSDRDHSVTPSLAHSPFHAMSLLEDIDPGVFVTEVEQSTHVLLEDGVIEKSPIHSPFPLTSPSPVCATLNSMSLGDNGQGYSPSPMDDWSNHHNMLHYSRYSNAGSSVGSEYSSSVDVCAGSPYLFTSGSFVSSSSAPVSSGQQYELDMLVSVCSGQPTATHHPATPVQTASFTPSHPPPSPTPSYHHSPAHFDPVHSYGGGSSPVHSLPATPSTPHTHSITTSPVTPHQQPHAYEGDPLISGQLTQMHGGGAASPIPSPHGMGTANYTSCSTQTPLQRTPSPIPGTGMRHKPSDSSDFNTPKQKQANRKPENEQLVHMPFFKFKRLLDSPSVTDEKKTDIKNVRRRGKNKIAAKMCRQRKQELVLGLQQEIEALKSHREQISVVKANLEEEVGRLKTHCLAIFRQKRQQH